MATYFLSKGISPAQVTAALDLCIEQCRFPVRLPDIMQRIPGYEVPAVEAEARAAWDQVVKFSEKYVGCDAEGRYGPEHGSYGAWGAPDESGRPRHGAECPQLSSRILDVVRRTGGWVQYKRMTDQDMPFQQKRFFDEYIAWTAVEMTDPMRMLSTTDQKALVAAENHGLAEQSPVPLKIKSLAADKSMASTNSKLARRSPVPELSLERKAELKRLLDEALAKRR